VALCTDPRRVERAPAGAARRRRGDRRRRAGRDVRTLPRALREAVPQGVVLARAVRDGPRLTMAAAGARTGVERAFSRWTPWIVWVPLAGAVAAIGWAWRFGFHPLYASLTLCGYLVTMIG